MEHYYHNIEGFSSEKEQGVLLETILNKINLTDKLKKNLNGRTKNKKDII